MSDIPDPKVSTRMHKHHGPRKGLKTVPKSLFVVVAVCIALLALIPLMKKPSRAPLPASTAPAPSSSYISDLQLSEAALDRATGKIKGVAKNTSAKVYEDVQVSYYVMDEKGVPGFAFGLVGRLEPHASSRFETQPLPPHPRYALREIIGTPR